MIAGPSQGVVAAVPLPLHGIAVRVHDPEAMANTRAELGNDGISYHEEAYEVLDQADALVIFTDWQEFRTPDFDLIA